VIGAAALARDKAAMNRQLLCQVLHSTLKNAIGASQTNSAKCAIISLLKARRLQFAVILSNFATVL
jgi:hypothetical protein